MEADLSRQGEDLRDIFRPGGGPSRLTLRRLRVLLERLPRESETARAQGSDGYSMLELLVMELNANPRHPHLAEQAAREASRPRTLKERQEHYARLGAAQALETRAVEDAPTLGAPDLGLHTPTE